MRFEQITLEKPLQPQTSHREKDGAPGSAESWCWQVAAQWCGASRTDGMHRGRHAR